MNDVSLDGGSSFPSPFPGGGWVADAGRILSGDARRAPYLGTR